MLTAFKGQGIAYEGQTYSAASNTVSGTAVSGNPVSYYNGTRWAMDWKNGTQLSTASASGKNVSYIYDKDGLRTSKTVNGVTYEYAYAGGKLMWQGDVYKRQSLRSFRGRQSSCIEIPAIFLPDPISVFRSV